MQERNKKLDPYGQAYHQEKKTPEQDVVIPQGDTRSRQHTIGKKISRRLVTSALGVGVAGLLVEGVNVGLPLLTKKLETNVGPTVESAIEAELQKKLQEAEAELLARKALYEQFKAQVASIVSEGAGKVKTNADALNKTLKDKDTTLKNFQRIIDDSQSIYDNIDPTLRTINGDILAGPIEGVETALNQVSQLYTAEVPVIRSTVKDEIGKIPGDLGTKVVSSLNALLGNGKLQLEAGIAKAKQVGNMAGDVEAKVLSQLPAQGDGIVRLAEGSLQIGITATNGLSSTIDRLNTALGQTTAAENTINQPKQESKR